LAFTIDLPDKLSGYSTIPIAIGIKWHLKCPPLLRATAVETIKSYLKILREAKVREIDNWKNL